MVRIYFKMGVLRTLEFKLRGKENKVHILKKL